MLTIPALRAMMTADFPCPFRGAAMRRIVPLLLIAYAAMAADAAPGKDTVNPAIAAQVSSLMQKNTDEVNAANAKAAKSLKALLAKYKKDKAASVLIAVKVHKLDPNDADALAILKDVPADQQDLLGQAGEPGKYITDVQAKAISDALTKGKFTAKDWEALPGKSVSISSDYYKALQGGTGAIAIHKDATYLIVPNVDDKWHLASDPPVNYLGGKGHLKLQGILKTDKDSRKDSRDVEIGKPFKASSDATLEFSADMFGAAVGSVRVLVYEVVPVGE